MKKVASILAVVVLFVVAIIATQTDNLDTLLACDDCWIEWDPRGSAIV